MPQQLVNTFQVKVDGTPLPSDIAQLLSSVVVDDSLNVPDLFVLSFRDPDHTVLSKAGLKMGAKVAISVISDQYPGGEPLLESGEVTAIEVDFHEGGTFTVARGFDQSNRLLRGRVTETYKNVTYSDIVRKVAGRLGLRAGQIDATTRVHDHVVQSNEHDWAFLSRLAAEVGYEVLVLDSKLSFRKPKDPSAAPAEGELASTGELQLVKGDNLISFHAVVTASEQVGNVEVRSWDPKTKKQLVGRAPAATKSAAVGIKPNEVAGTFGSPTYVGVTTPYGAQADVDGAAAAIAEHISGSGVELEAKVRGNPKLRAGRAVSLGLVGEPFDGKYKITSSRHVYDPNDGYVTNLTVSGRQERSLLSLTSAGMAAAGGGSGGGGGSDGRISGVVPALVTNVNDPDKQCRVKLKFPWLSDAHESDWVRTVAAGAGKDRGAVILPEVNDEVLVAFEQGDPRRPYVLGGLYNGVDVPKLPEALIDGAGKVNWRGFVSRTGHCLVFRDTSGKEGITLATGDQGLDITLDKSQMRIRVKSNGEIQIEGSKDVKIKAGTNLSIEAGAKIDMKATTISIQGNGPVTVKGTPIQLN